MFRLVPFSRRPRLQSSDSDLSVNAVFVLVISLYCSGSCLSLQRVDSEKQSVLGAEGLKRQFSERSNSPLTSNTVDGPRRVWRLRFASLLSAPELKADVANRSWKPVPHKLAWC